MKKSKKFRILWHRRADAGQVGPLPESECVETTSMKRARDYGKRIAEERGWWLVEVALAPEGDQSMAISIDSPIVQALIQRAR